MVVQEKLNIYLLLLFFIKTHIRFQVMFELVLHEQSDFSKIMYFKPTENRKCLLFLFSIYYIQLSNKKIQKIQKIRKKYDRSCSSQTPTLG